MKKLAGDCTNLHITYPALVYGYWAVIRANRLGPVPSDAPKPLQSDDGMMRRSDMAVKEDRQPQPCIVRYHQALSGLTGRNGIRDDVSKYEAVALTLVNVDENDLGTISVQYPAQDSLLCFEKFLHIIYTQYDLRFVYQAPELVSRTYRIGWDESSPALQNWRIAEYQARFQEDEDIMREIGNDASQ